MRAFITFILKKDMHAAWVGFAFIMLSFVGLPGAVAASILLAFVTMRKGYRSGAIVLAFIALPAVAFLMLKQFNVFDLVLLRCVLVWFLAGMLAKYASWDFLLEILTICGLGIVILCHLIFSHVSLFWGAETASFIQNIQANSEFFNLNLTPDQVKLLITMVSRYATGGLVFVLMVASIVELLFARTLNYSVNGIKGKVSLEFSNIRVRKTLIYLSILVLLAVFLRIAILQDCLFVMVFPFALAGLSYMHYLSKQHKQMSYVLIFIYLGLFFIPVVLVSLLMVVGCVDGAYDFRKRFVYQ